MADARSKADWEKVEAQYRAGVMSLREIAAEQTAAGNPLTEGAIRKKAKKEEWTRDLAAKVRAKAADLVRKATVRSEVREETPTEKMTVEVEAQVVARIEIGHRTDVPRARKLVMQLMDELEFQTSNPELFEQLEQILATSTEEGGDGKDKDRSKLWESFNRAMSLGNRSSTMKTLADALKNLVALEREVFGITLSNGNGGHEASLDDLA
jgi:hypothetical protein